MSKHENPLDPIRKANEEEYFRKQNAALAEKIKARLEIEKAGIQDEALAAQLVEAGFDQDSIRALFIVPLIEIAWADHRVQDEEKDEIFKVLEMRGIEKTSKAYNLVSKWIIEGPKNTNYLHAKTLVEPLLGAVKKDADWILQASRKVAEATGGLFGIGIGSKTSLDEEKLIKRIADRIAHQS